MGTHVEADDRDPDTVRFDLLVDQVNTLCAKMDAAMEARGNNTQTVIHKTAGMGPWAAAAVTACFFTFLGLILLAMLILPDIHDLKAWSDIYRTRIQEISATIKKEAP